MVEFRTVINIEPSKEKITYNSKVIFLGSCFASSIGSRMQAGRMNVMINPAGSIYNPVSVCNTLDRILERKECTIEDLYNNNGIYISFNHSTDFSSESPEELAEKINIKAEESLNFFKSVKFLFVTFGTARVYRFKETGQIVSNCHKIQSDKFSSELLSVDSIVRIWEGYLNKLHSLFPDLKIVFTISPVRHWKDGNYGNQISKSILFLAVDKLLKHPSEPQYFPAYELLMDDLRDYRFYAEDLLHPSVTAIDYIWQKFSECYLDEKTLLLWKEVSKITRACSHRINSQIKSRLVDFAEGMLIQIVDIEKKIPGIDFSNERQYFNSLLK